MFLSLLLLFSKSHISLNLFLVCDCNSIGTIAGTDCEPLGGQCRCKTGVFGRECDQCKPGYYNFTIRGCDRMYRKK